MTPHEIDLDAGVQSAPARYRSCSTKRRQRDDDQSPFDAASFARRSRSRLFDRCMRIAARAPRRRGARSHRECSRARDSRARHTPRVRMRDARRVERVARNQRVPIWREDVDEIAVAGRLRDGDGTAGRPRRCRRPCGSSARSRRARWRMRARSSRLRALRGEPGALGFEADAQFEHGQHVAQRGGRRPSRCRAFRGAASSTKLPMPWRVSITSLACSREMPSRTTVRLTPSPTISSDSVGSLSPGLSAPPRSAPTTRRRLPR